MDAAIARLTARAAEEEAQRAAEAEIEPQSGPESASSDSPRGRGRVDWKGEGGEIARGGDVAASERRAGDVDRHPQPCDGRPADRGQAHGGDCPVRRRTQADGRDRGGWTEAA